jgi:hypothetical protein
MVARFKLVLADRLIREEASMQIAFTLYMIVLFPGGAPVVTNVGPWQKASDCRTAADAAFVRRNTEGEQVPSISFVCVPRSGFGTRGMPIQP